MSNSNMHVLVTGATGFVGSRLCNKLLEQGFTVTGVSRDWTKNDNHHSKLANSNPLFHPISCELSNPNEVKKIFIESNEPISYVFHLAGQPLGRDIEGPHAYFRNNFDTTLNLLECCKEFGIKKFVFSSSIAVYGLSPSQFEPKYLPVDEMHDARPYDYYDLSKYLAEQVCRYYHERFGISTTILRYSRIYGPGTDKAIVYKAATKALANKPIEVFGDVSTDFVYVDDVVSANIAATKTVGFEIFNIGGGTETTLYEVCSKVINILGSKSEIKYHPEPKSRFSLDISKARETLSYHSIALEEGLQKTVCFVRDSNDV